jgi:putative PIN family toxin of toxin-antitoxin system
MAEVLERDFNWSLERTNQARIVLSSISQHVTPHIDLDVAKSDPDDNRILKCAEASRSDYVVTHDKHLLILKINTDTSIIKPVDFLAMLQHRLHER